jgi:predicted RNase H-like HicB family nuclease
LHFVELNARVNAGWPAYGEALKKYNKDYKAYFSLHSINKMPAIFFIFGKKVIMERNVNLHIEKLSEGYYLATSENIQGLVAQGRTVAETIEIAKDVAKKLIEAQEEQIPKLKILTDSFDYPIVIGV